MHVPMSSLQTYRICLFICLGFFAFGYNFDTLSTLVEFVYASCLSQILGFGYSFVLPFFFFFFNRKGYLSLVFQC